MKRIIQLGLLISIIATPCMSSGKSNEKYLEKYLKKIFQKPTEESYKAICEDRGDYGIPDKLPANPQLLKFLAYSADHYRTRYLMLGKKPYKNNIGFEYQIDALMALWSDYGNENARQRAVVILKYAVRNIDKLSNEELRSKIDTTGLKNFWHPLMKNAVWYYALLYKLTGNEHYAQKTCLILQRFGKVFKKWPVHFKKRVRGQQKFGQIFVDKNNPPPANLSYGFWGWWGNCHDLPHAMPLLKAWTLIKNSKTYKKLSSENRRIIHTDLLELMVEKHLLFKFRALHNQNKQRILGLIDFGIVLKKAEYIHQAVRWIKEMLHIGYRRDGGWYEGTISYAYPVTKGLLEIFPKIKGWSDPDDYIDKVDGMHFSNFDIEKEFAYNLKEIKEWFTLLTLPNGKPIAFEDTIWNSKGKYFNKPLPESVPFLLGASSIGMLGFGKKANQNRLYMHWEGTHNHDHYDQLGIVLWSHGEEISSETTYRGLKPWNRSTAAHNTVVVDEKNQLHHRIAAKKMSNRLKLYPQYKFGELWGQHSKFDDSGTLKLWNVSEKDIQIIQVDGVKSYKNVSKYQRTLCMVKINEKHFYILDIFEVIGGEIHDWMLHGNLSKRYKINIFGMDKKLHPQKWEIGKYLKNIRSIETNTNIIADFKYKNDSIFRTIIAGVPNTKAIIADGPAIRLQKEPSCWEGSDCIKTKTKQTSEFLCIRRKGPANIFIAIHEVFRGVPCVKNVNTIGEIIKIKLEGREDTFELLDGTIKYSGNGKTVIFGKQNLMGNVFAVTSMDRGNKDNSFIVSGSLKEKVKDGELIIIIDGDGRYHPYIIKKLISMTGNKTRVITKGETGMLLEKNLMIMTYYPSWDIAGKLTYKIPGKQIIK